jgi:hypothetical protein
MLCGGGGIEESTTAGKMRFRRAAKEGVKISSSLFKKSYALLNKNESKPKNCACSQRVLQTYSTVGFIENGSRSARVRICVGDPPPLLIGPRHSVKRSAVVCVCVWPLAPLPPHSPTLSLSRLRPWQQHSSIAV